MKRKLTVVLLIVALLLSVSVQIASAGNGDGMVTVKQFVVSNMPLPNVIHYFNKVIDLGNGLKGEMLIGKGEKTYLDVWKPNSGKRDLYKWNGSQWVYLHSITDIVPGFEKPMTINTYKYATWDEYAHTVPTDNNPTPNPNPPSSGLTVSLSGPAKLNVNQQGIYTATVHGGTPPYTLTWSSDGYISSESYNAYYKWSKEGKYTVTVAVRDLNGQTATASMDVTVEDNSVVFKPTTLYFIAVGNQIDEYGKKSDSSLQNNYLGEIEFNDPTAKTAEANIQKFSIGGVDITKSLMQKTFDLNNQGHGKFALLLKYGDIYGIPLGDNIPYSITVQFSDGSSSVIKNGSIPHIYYGHRFHALAQLLEYMGGNGGSVTPKYHYWVMQLVEYQVYDSITKQYKEHVEVDSKEITTDKYYATLESLQKDSAYQQAISALSNGNADVKASKEVYPTDVTAQLIANITTDALKQSGAFQHTSDRTINAQFDKKSGAWKGTLCSSDGKKVNPYVTYSYSDTVNVSYLEIAAQSYSYLLSPVEDVPGQNFEPEILSNIKYTGDPVKEIKLPNDSYKAIIFEKGKKLKYEIPSQYKDMVITSIKVNGQDSDQWQWNSNYNAWEVDIDLTPPPTLSNNMPSANIEVYYDSAHDTIRKIVNSSSIIVNNVDDHGVAYGNGTVEYLLTSGKYLTPSANLIKDVYSSSNPKVKIAIAYINNGYIYVVGISKGNGILTLSKEELQGPFGTSIPITVEKTGIAGNIDFTVNGVDVNNAGVTKWLNDFPDGKWYKILEGSSAYSISHAYRYSEYFGFLYKTGPYESIIGNKSDVPIVVDVTWTVPHQDYWGNISMENKSTSITIRPGSSYDVAYDCIVDIAKHAVYDKQHKSTSWTSKISYVVKANINGEYITVGSASDVVEVSPKQP